MKEFTNNLLFFYKIERRSIKINCHLLIYIHTAKSNIMNSNYFNFMRRIYTNTGMDILLIIFIFSQQQEPLSLRTKVIACLGKFCM